MKKISASMKKSFKKKNAFMKVIQLTHKQACALCKEIENPKPLDKEVIERAKRIRKSFTKDFNGLTI